MTTQTATTARVPGSVRYSVWMDSETITLIRDVYAGVSGPMQSIPTGKRDLASVTAWVERQGFRVISDWAVDHNYNGLLLTAELAES
jgi:hypothetical protein